MDTPGEPRPSILEYLKKHRAQVMAIVTSIAITAAILVFREQLADLSSYGYVGVFFISLLGNATVVLPVPSLAVVFAGGGVLNPLLVALIAGVAEPLGELTGYLAGYGGSAVIQDSERFERLRPWIERRGFLTIFVLSAIPNPLFDLAGIAAGMARFPVSRFLVACWLGKTLKALGIAYLGKFSLQLFGF